MEFYHVQRDEGSNLSAVIDGKLYPVDDSHEHFEDLVQAAVDNDEEGFLALFDSSARAEDKFAVLSERVRVANSRVYVDGFEVSDVYADTLVEFLDDDVSDSDREALVNFLSKVYSNVSEGIRENLSRWLKAENFTILPNGNILGYRGLRDNYTSVHAGPGIVNGERVNGHLDNSVGNVLEIDADLVENDPSRGCASGLHVGTYEYAKGWSPNGVVVSVEVDPRHVRSVPFQCSSSKMRVSKYRVLETVTDKSKSSVDDTYSDYDDDLYNEYGNDTDYDYYY